jgi:hypothetical protein
VNTYAAVDFGSPGQLPIIKYVTLGSMVAVVVLPLVFGLLYAKFLLIRLQKRITSTGQIQDESTNQNLSENLPGTAIVALPHSRLSDMKTNAVFRLWWKKQQKIHGVSMDNDIESQVRHPAAQSTGRAVILSSKRETSQKHKKHSKDANPLDESTKHKKKKKEKPAGEGDSSHTGEGQSMQKDKKAKEEKDQPPGLSQREDEHV